VLCRVFKKNIELPSVADGKRSGSSAYMALEDVGRPSMSTADELSAACALPPLMDVSGSGVVPSMSLSAAAASIELPPPAHVTCFSNALEAQFLNPPFILPSPPGPAHGAVAMASASPFLQMRYDGGMMYGLLEESGGWYSKLGERERLSGASQDTGVTSEVNPAEIISSSRQHMNHEFALWDY
jgi:hypothetical protein